MTELQRINLGAMLIGVVLMNFSFTMFNVLGLIMFSLSFWKFTSN